MTYYKVDPAACKAIFTQTEGEISTGKSTHSSLRGEVEELGSLRARGEAAQIASALRGVYNRVLTRNMTAAEQKASKAVAGGRGAVAAIQQGDQEMARRTELDARNAGEIKIMDGMDI